MAHVFLSYVREDQVLVDRLASELKRARVEVWIDRDQIKPGQRWQVAIAKAIEEGAFFLACFSEAQEQKEQRGGSYMQEELNLAIDKLRHRPADHAWFIPVLLSECSIPALSIRAGETLSDFQWVALYKDWDKGILQLLSALWKTSPEILVQSLLDKLYSYRGRDPQSATKNDWCMVLAKSVHDLMLNNWLQTVSEISGKVVSFLSAEFLIGPQLGNNLINLGQWEQFREALSHLGLNLELFLGEEAEPGLGSGGLGRLAACYLDSLATQEIPATGYGIRYEFGVFSQYIRDGWQLEGTDKWLRLGNPWEICRLDVFYLVDFGGHTETYHDQTGGFRVRWVPGRMVKGVAYDYLVPGYQTRVTDLLRLWAAEGVESFDLGYFNEGDYYAAVQEKVVSENITKVLSLNDESEAGKILRLMQQYFLVSCSLQDMILFHLKMRQNSLDSFHESFAVQLSDTHPAIAIAELMRLLMDVHLLPWEQAWDITRKSISYTTHSLLPEELETWSLPLFAKHLPRHLEIIYEINRRFLDEVRFKYPLDEDRVRRMSMIDEVGEKSIRMSHLACVGSYAINGVAALHTELLKHTVFKDFYDLWPEKFLNVTNGVTPRRWMILSNPQLAALIIEKIGDSWISHMEGELRRLEPWSNDPEFQNRWRLVKRDNKADLAGLIQERTGIAVDPDTLFDIQVTRIHEYKRQHLNVLHIVTLYNRLKKNPNAEITPRTFIFGGKAAPGYFMAKLIIKLINSAAEMVNEDPDVAGRLKVVFFPDFNVKNSQCIYPAADLSEQISTSGKEASSTGNMKFAMNGALTIGTPAGTNVDIREEVGPGNFFLFGLKAEEIQQLKGAGYDPRRHYDEDMELREVLDLVSSGFFSRGDRELFKPMMDSLLHHDEFMLLADYRSYVDQQDEVGKLFQNGEQWTRMSILNTARMGKFSSDRAIREYCEKIWRIQSR